MSIPVYTPTNKIVHTVKVDFFNRSVSKPVNLVQYDCSLPIVAVELSVNINDILDITHKRSSITVKYRNSVGEIHETNALGISDDGKVIFFEITKDMTKYYGFTKVVIELKQKHSVAQTPYIFLNVEENPIQTEVE